MLYPPYIPEKRKTIELMRIKRQAKKLGGCFEENDIPIPETKFFIADEIIGLNVSINTPLCKINSNYVRTLKLLNMIGIKYVSCSGLIVTGNACNNDSKSTQLSEEQLYSILEEATKYCEEQHMEISFTSPGWVSEDKLSKLGLSIPACGACLSNMAIAPDGSVVPCQSWLSDDSLGNILKQPWKKIWNSPRCKEIRESSATMKHECPLREKESKK